MARTPAQRGRIGNWLVESRLARGYDSQAKACEAIRRLTGWALNRSQYASWESGDAVPNEDNLARLEAFYGPAPEVPVARAAADAAILLRIAEAQERTALALEAVSERLARLDGTVAGGMIGLGDALGLLAHALGATLPESAPGPAARSAQDDPGAGHSSNQTGRGRP